MEPVISIFSFRGRIGRLEWWGIALLVTIIWTIYFAMFGLNYLKMLFGGYFQTEESMQAFLEALLAQPNLLFFGGPAVFIGALWINFAALAKRYHDRDKSAWWILIMFIPVIGTLWQLIECGFFAGTPGGNGYGPDPGRRGLSVDGLAGYDLSGSAMRDSQPAAPTRAARREAAQPSGARPLAPAAFGRRIRPAG